MTNTTKNVKPVNQSKELNKPVLASFGLAFDYHYVEATNRLKETFHEAVKQSETERKDQELIVPYKGLSGPFDAIEESLYWLISAAAVAAILFFILTV
jgi:hypothetical protein